MNKGLLLAFMGASFLACATGGGTVGDSSGGGLFPGDKDHEAKAMAAVKQRVAFDIDCSDVQILRISDVTRLGQQMTSMSLGVTGCGKKASYYVECVSNWGNITCNPRINTTVVQGNVGQSG